MEAAPRQSARPEAHEGGGSSGAAWGARASWQGATMLGPFLHTSPPHEKEKGKKVAWVIAWLALIMGFVVALLSVALPP